jgi:hypothetical protein
VRYCVRISGSIRKSSSQGFPRSKGVVLDNISLSLSSPGYHPLRMAPSISLSSSTTIQHTLLVRTCQSVLCIDMGERKGRTSSQTAWPSYLKPAALQPQSDHAELVQCPEGTLARLRRLHEAEVITLFTPFVPHPPSTTLAKDMDPFEPLGRALPRQVRHVPYRLDSGMTELHSDFLSASGAVIIVVCATDNVISSNAQAFEQQVDFARDMWMKIGGISTIAGIPVILLLVSSDAAGRVYTDAMREFPALVTTNDYTISALANTVHVLFGQ